MLVNAHLLSTGMGKAVLLVCLEEPGTQILNPVNVRDHSSGMDTLVSRWTTVTMVKCGMFTLTPANALKPLSGMVINVPFFLNVMEDRLSTVTTNVSVPMDMCGAKTPAFSLHVLVDKYGLDLNVSVLQVSTSMVPCVLNVSMVRNGMPPADPAHASLDINGMASTVKFPTPVPMEEFGMQLINNVSALKTIIGVDMPVSLSPNAQEDNTSIPPSVNVFVCPAINGMEMFVFNAQMEEPGM